MRLIKNTNVAFRCPDSLKDRLEAYAAETDVHVSVVIRVACGAYLKEEAPHLFWSLPPVVTGGGSTASGWLANFAIFEFRKVVSRWFY